MKQHQAPEQERLRKAHDEREEKARRLAEEAITRDQAEYDALPWYQKLFRSPPTRWR